MKNEFKDNRLNLLAQYCDKAYKWVEKAAQDEVELRKEENSLGIAICQLHNMADAAHEVLPVNSTIGVFGASQAGKSYLVSALASNGGGEGLVANWEGKEISFFHHLNPTGGNREATGLVTRFTRMTSPAVKGFPVTLKILNEVELIKILVNSFYLDMNLEAAKEFMIEYDSRFKDKTKLDALFEELRGDEYQLKEGESSYVTENDIVELSEYVYSHAAFCCLMSEEFKPDCDFWNKVRHIISSLNLKGRGRLFSLFWGNLKAFNNLYETIAPEMEKFKGKREVYAPLNAFVTEIDGKLMQIPQKTLIDIHALDGVFREELPLVVDISLDRNASDIAKIRFPILAFATAEISFPVPEASQSGNFDVLDFPGARSRKREEISIWKDADGLAKNGQNTATEFIRRGKVGYLIERYCQRHEIDVLLFCSSVEGQGEVAEVTPYLSSWVYENIGKDPEDRASYEKIPVVGAFTKFDACFTRDIGKEAASLSDIGKTITTAMERYATGWIQNWAHGQEFNQFFFVRRPNLHSKNDVYEFNSEDVETGIRPEYQSYIDAYKKEIVKDPDMKYVYEFNHYKQMGRAEDTPVISEVLKANDGGIKYLSSFLKDNFTDYNFGKEKFNDSIKSLTSNLRNRIGKYARESGEQALRIAHANALSKFRQLASCDVVAGTFGRFRSFIEINEDLARENYLENFSGGRSSNAFRFAKALTKMREDNLESMRNGVFFDVMLADILRYWEIEKKNVEDYPEDDREAFNFFIADNGSLITDKNVLKDKFHELMQFLTVELSKAYNAMNVEQAVIDAIDPYESPTSKKDDLCDGQCARALQIISDFNTYLCVGKQDNSNIERIKVRGSADSKATSEESSRPLFKESSEHKNFMPDIKRSNVDNIRQHYCNDYFSVLLNVICAKNVTAESKYNISPELNREICEILSEIDSVF